MMRLRVDASIDKGTVVLERYSALAGELATIEENRASALASTNAVADGIAAPVIAEMQQLRALLEPWWARVAPQATAGKRKTVELGGCIIGTKSGSTSLSFAPGDDKLAVSTLQAAKWAKGYIRTTVSVDKVAVKKGLAGKHGDQLAALGFAVPPAVEVFVLDRVVQEGTLG